MQSDKILDESVTTSLSSSSLSSLASRLDRLEFMTTYLERKSHSTKWADDGEERVEQEQLVPLDLALKDAQSKGSLLDRIASLEHRLIQLCLEIESGAVSRKGSSYSMSEFRLSREERKNATQVSTARSQVTEQQKIKHSGSSFWRRRKIISSKRVSTPQKNGSSRLHFTLFGC